MLLKSRNLSHFKTRETIEGKKQLFLSVDCDNCPVMLDHNNTKESCISCILNTLKVNKNKKYEFLLIGNRYGCQINHETIVQFSEYFKIAKKLKKLLNNIYNARFKNCHYVEFKCEILESLFEFSESLVHEFYDPIRLYQNICQIQHSVIHTENKDDPNCFKCHLYLNNEVFLMKNMLHKLKLFNSPNLTENIVLSELDYLNFYKLKFNLDLSPVIVGESINNTKLDTRDQIQIEKLYLGKGDLFEINIYETKHEFEKWYDVEFAFGSTQDRDYFKAIINDIESKLDLILSEQVLPLEDLIEKYKTRAENYILSKYNYNTELKEKLSFLTALKKIRMLKIFPLLLDDKVEEIFLDSPKESLYINHQKYGRCRTNICFDKTEIIRLKTFLRLYSGKRLDYKNPSIKFVIKNKYFYCRFSCDVAPIHPHNFALDIRKLDKNILTFQDLLKNRTINPQIAAFLYFSVLKRANITVTGETDTGKTTLINLLDLVVPMEYRKVYVENAAESLDQSNFNRHQLKYMTTLTEGDLQDNYSKHHQIKRLLHRTPDIIYLGEILTKEEAKAMFHCLSAGLKGFQTVHAQDVDSLINRFLFHFNIDPSCLKDLDLIVLMKKERTRRILISISEIDNTSGSCPNYLFNYNPTLQDWVSKNNLYKSRFIQKLCKYEDLTKTKFETYLKIYTEIFELILRIEDLPLEKYTDLFDKLAYFSYSSFEKLYDFWESWKNQGV